MDLKKDAELLLELTQAKEELNAAKQRYESLQSEVIARAAQRTQKSLVGVIGNQQIVGTVVYREVYKFDDAGLAKAIGKRKFNKLCNIKIDKSKVEEAIVEGVLDPSTVAKYTTVTQSAPHVRLTTRANDDD